MVVQAVQDPFAPSSKLVSIGVTVFLLFKTFYFLRVLDGFSYLVKMLEQVARDIRTFLFFYFFLMWVASLALNII